MINLLYVLAYVALPIATYVISRNLTWTVALVTGSVGLVGAWVSFVINMGDSWTFAALQLATLGALVFAFIITLLARKRANWPTVSWRRHTVAVFLPVLAVLAVLVISRMAAGPRAGFFTAVGFLVRRQHAEDNAKWLDFTSQLVTGQEIVQGVAMGGPLQLFLVIIATTLAAASLLLLGGVNEVFVSANTVVYAQYFLAAMAPFVFVPLVEARVRRRSDSPQRDFIPAPLIWAGMFVLIVSIIAVSGLGHLTLEFVFLATVLWIGVFLVGSRVPHVYALTSLGIVTISLVWFPLLPVSLVVMAAGVIAVFTAFARRGIKQPGLWAVAVAWLAAIVFTWPEYRSAIGYMTESTSAAESITSAAGGGISASGGMLSALALPAFDLLSSQGGTEVVDPILAVLLLLSTVLATMFIVRRRASDSRARMALAFGPAVLLGAYAISLAIIGTWWAGGGPNYGALKTTFLATIAITSVAVPLALMEIDRRKAGTTIVRIAGIAGVAYLLTIDGLLPRAAVYLSPQQWPTATGTEKGYWWPAEVQTQAEQSIASLPIACAYRPIPTDIPSALPNGQTAYSCTRILAGLSGADTTAQPLVDWQRREWLTNTPAWLNEYPNLMMLPEDVRMKSFILLDVINNVNGLESVQSFMDRYKPDWAWEQSGD